MKQTHRHAHLYRKPNMHVHVFSHPFFLFLMYTHTHTPIDRQLTGNQTPLFVKFHFSSHELIKEAAIDSAALKERAI